MKTLSQLFTTWSGKASTRPRRLLVVALIAVALNALWAQTRIDENGFSSSGSVIGSDVLYSIGGGRAVSMTPAGNMQSIGVGLGWNSNLICGDMSLSTTLQNQLHVMHQVVPGSADIGQCQAGRQLGGLEALQFAPGVQLLEAGIVSAAAEI